jgi:hypothetical protein
MTDLEGKEMKTEDCLMRPLEADRNSCTPQDWLTISSFWSTQCHLTIYPSCHNAHQLNICILRAYLTPSRLLN